MALDVIASGTTTLIVKDIFDTFAAFASGTAPGSGTWSLSLINSSTGSSVSLPPIQTIWVRDTISATPSGSIFGDRQYGRAVAGAKFTRAGRHWRKSWRGGVLAEKAVGYDRDLSPFAALACRWLGNSPMVFRKHYLQVSPDVIERATGRTRNVRDEREDGEGGQSARMPDQPSPPHNGPLGEKLGGCTCWRRAARAGRSKSRRSIRYGKYRTVPQSAAVCCTQRNPQSARERT